MYFKKNQTFRKKSFMQEDVHNKAFTTVKNWGGDISTKTNGK